MTRFFCTLFIVASFVSCNNNKTETAADGTTQTTGNSSENASSENKPNGFWQKLVMNDIPDGKGGVAAIIPLPADWKMNSEGAVLAGPNGIRVKDYAGQSFMVNYDQNLNYAYSQTKMRSMPNIEQLIQEDFVPTLGNQGLEYV